MFDISGNLNHATTSGVISSYNSSGNGATIAVQYLEGDISSKVVWPIGSIPSAFTICSVTRYVTDGNMGRILAGKSIDWLHGHDGYEEPKRGVASYGGLKTSYVSVGVLTDWLVMCGNNGGRTPNNILVDGIGSGVSVGGTGSDFLSINMNPFSPEQNSDWAFRELMIWNTVLSETDMLVVSAALSDALHAQVFSFAVLQFNHFYYF